MTLARPAAAKEMRGLFDTAWASAGPVKYDNVAVPGTFPPASGPWARLVIRHGDRARAAIGGAAGNRRFRSTGTLIVQIFQDPGAGLSGATDLGTIVRDAFEGVTSVGGVEFREVSVNEIGEDGDHFQTNVTAFFEYDEIR